MCGVQSEVWDRPPGSVRTRWEQWEGGGANLEADVEERGERLCGVERGNASLAGVKEGGEGGLGWCDGNSRGLFSSFFPFLSS